jgi:hypothetical protein
MLQPQDGPVSPSDEVLRRGVAWRRQLKFFSTAKAAVGVLELTTTALRFIPLRRPDQHAEVLLSEIGKVSYSWPWNDAIRFSAGGTKYHFFLRMGDRRDQEDPPDPNEDRPEGLDPLGEFGANAGDLTESVAGLTGALGAISDGLSGGVGGAGKFIGGMASVPVARKIGEPWKEQLTQALAKVRDGPATQGRGISN